MTTERAVGVGVEYNKEAGEGVERTIFEKRGVGNIG